MKRQTGSLCNVPCLPVWNTFLVYLHHSVPEVCVLPLGTIKLGGSCV